VSSKAPDVIIIRKKARHHHGHHGGAWKVAYADFVTAMMAFFLVMWLVGQSPQVRQAVAHYFRDPGAFDQAGRGVLPGTEAGMSGGGQSGSFANKATNPDVEEAKRALQKAAEHLRAAVQLTFADVQDRIEITVTDEGLRIELREAPDDGFFSSGSAAMKAETEKLLAVIAKELGQLTNKIAVEGHTDSRPYAAANGQYTNWELSADRANAARRVLARTGVNGKQIEGVRGFADTKPRTPDTPFDAGNRRISIIVRREDAAARK
jgi:chemotaxis protein MotB